MEKLLIESCLEIFAEDLVVGIQDLGAAGISCATSELASAGTGGMHVVLDDVPLRDASLSPEEILMSESQERMCAIVEPARLDRFLAICDKWDVSATVIGEVTDTGRLVIQWRGETVVDVLARTVAHEGPVYDRPYARPQWQDQLQADDPASAALTRPSGPDQLRATLLRMIASANLASKSWVTNQYDRYVQGNTVLAQPDDCGMIRLDDRTGLGVGLATDGNGRFCRLDPYNGVKLVLAEACRNVAAGGARPVAVTNCLNFGSPEDPDVMWQFTETVRGLADGCLELGIPVTGGNVSFYNQTGDAPILPTPVIGVLGVIQDVQRRTPMGLPADGGTVLLLGTTRDELAGSEWAHEVHGHLGGLPPQVDLAAERRLAELLVAASADGYVLAAHDVSVGGVAQTLVDMALRSDVGAQLTLPDGLDPFVALFSESAGRAVVIVPAGTEADFAARCATHEVPVTVLGQVGGAALGFDGLFDVAVSELRSCSESMLAALFG
jgi:phosphoribosylformylglycinamidine synthase